MGLDGRLRNAQLVGDLFVQQAFADHGQHPELLGREASQAFTGGFGFSRHVDFFKGLRWPPDITLKDLFHRILNDFQ
ncbi:hypothetical protein D3C76_1586960 [compost metagenome]